MARNTPDPQQEALFREVDEDLRHEQMIRLWKRYGVAIITAAILVVAVVAGYEGWKAYSARQRAADAGAYERAVADSGSAPVKAAGALARVVGQAQEGMATLAQLRRAALLSEAGHPAEALAVYQAVANDDDADPVLRGMATLRYALLGMDHGVSTGELGGLVAPLTAPGQPLAFSAMQIRALLAMKDGKTGEAGKTLQGMIDSPQCPPDLRALASRLLARISPSAASAAAS